jgi:hypothetical protein
MATIQRSLVRRIARTGDGFEYLLPNASLAPAGEAIVDGFVRAIFLRAILPAAPDLEDMHDPAQYTPVILALGSGLVRRQMRNDLRPLLIIKPKQIRVHGLGPLTLTRPLNQNMIN